jgi:RNA polymerase II-associated factor 1
MPDEDPQCSSTLHILVFFQEIDFKEDEEYEYKMAREYNWNVKSKASKGYEENFFFLFRDEGVYYNELETRVRLSKRRLKAGQHIGNSKLVVKHRPLNKQESKMQRYRCVFVTIAHGSLPFAT